MLCAALPLQWLAEPLVLSNSSPNECKALALVCGGLLQPLLRTRPEVVQVVANNHALAVVALVALRMWPMPLLPPSAWDHAMVLEALLNHRMVLAVVPLLLGVQSDPVVALTPLMLDLGGQQLRQCAVAVAAAYR
jgi:hypothetical protein